MFRNVECQSFSFYLALVPFIPCRLLRLLYIGIPDNSTRMECYKQNKINPRPLHCKTRTPENRGGGRLGRPEKKFGHEIGGVGRKVRIGTDLPRDGQNLFGQALKIPKNPLRIPGDRMG